MPTGIASPGRHQHGHFDGRAVDGARCDATSRVLTSCDQGLELASRASFDRLAAGRKRAGSSAPTRRVQGRPRRSALDADAVTCHYVGAIPGDLDDNSPRRSLDPTRSVGDDRRRRPRFDAAKRRFRRRGYSPQAWPTSRTADPLPTRPGHRDPLHSDDCVFRARTYRPSASVRRLARGIGAPNVRSRTGGSPSSGFQPAGLLVVRRPPVQSSQLRRPTIWVARAPDPRVRRWQAVRSFALAEQA